VLASLLAGCTSGQLGVEPPVHQADVANGTALQFAVGTARFATGSVYLNTVVTYRQANGLSGTLYNTPSIAGPAGFVVPNNAITAGPPPLTDIGTNTILATPPTQPGTTAVVTTFGQSGGAFAYGFAPANSNEGGTANYPQLLLNGAANNALYRDAASNVVVGPGQGATAALAGGGGALIDSYSSPFYLSSRNRIPYLLGPPLVPDFHNGTFPPGFLGYPSGFTIFATAPVAGSYTLTVVVPGNSPGAPPVTTKTATGTVTATAGLPAEPVPAVASTGGGGASFTVAAPPAGVTKQILYVVDVSSANGAPTFYSIDVSAGGTFALSTANGPTNAQGQHVAPFKDGDPLFAYVVGADYDFVAPAPPGNTQQSPALPAQADVSTSLVYETVYSSTAGPLAHARSVR
jgi:hypothetical protein